MMRDSERQRTYDAEALAFTETAYEARQGLATLEECCRLLTADPQWRAHYQGVVVVRQARVDARRSSASASGEIRIAFFQDSLATLCHEMAHLISSDGHGPYFRSYEVELLSLAAGRPAGDKLAASFRRAGLDLAIVPAWKTSTDGLVSYLLERPSLREDRHARRVAGLLAKAASTTNEEAEALKRKAFELSSRYGVTAARLAALDEGELDEMTERKIRLGAGPYVGVRCDLLNAVAASHWCKVVWHNDRLGRLVSVLGHRSDVLATLVMFNSLDYESQRDMMQVATSGNVLAFRRSWLKGYVREVADQLEASLKTEVARSDAKGGPGVELVLRERQRKSAEFAKERYPSIRAVSSARSSSKAAYDQGRRAGTKARLSRELPPGQRALGSAS